VAGVLALIADLTQKLWERPTPKFSEAVASCDWGGLKPYMLKIWIWI